MLLNSWVVKELALNTHTLKYSHRAYRTSFSKGFLLVIALPLWINMTVFSGSGLEPVQVIPCSGCRGDYIMDVDNFGNIHIATLGGVVCKIASNGREIWQTQIGMQERNVVISDLSVDVDGDVYVAGWIENPQNWRSSNALVISLDSSGNVKWRDEIDIDARDQAAAVETGSDGTVFIVGHTLRRPTGAIGTRSWDVFIRKYNAEGELLWADMLGMGSDEKVTGLTVDSEGNVYMIGYTTGTLAVNEKAMTLSDGQTLSVTNTTLDCFLVKYYPSGHMAWIKQFGEINALGWVATDASLPDADIPVSVVATLDGSVYVLTNTGHEMPDYRLLISTGEQSLCFELEGYALQTSYPSLWKFTATGETLWRRRLATSGAGLSLGLDAVGNVCALLNLYESESAGSGFEWIVRDLGFRILKYDALGAKLSSYLLDLESGLSHHAVFRECGSVYLSGMHNVILFRVPDSR